MLLAIVNSGGTKIYYDDRGDGEPALLCIPGFTNDHSIFAPLAKRLSQDHRVLIMDLRGHGKSQASEKDFGFAEIAEDAIAVIQGSSAQSVIPIAQGQLPWVALALRRQLGERVPKIVASSWPVISTAGNPLAARFFAAMEGVQDNARWRNMSENLVTMFVSGAPDALQTQIRNQMLSHGFEMWSRAGREISAVFGREGDPLTALSKLSPPVPVLHVYSQPPAADYLATQESFARDHSWFQVRRLEAESQFPLLEAPDETAAVIKQFID